MTRSLGWTFALVVALIAALVPLPQAALAQQEEDKPIVVRVSPQVWFSHIPTSPSVQLDTPTQTATTTPRRTLYPQWGTAFSLTYDRWTLSLSYLRVDYDFDDLYRTKPGFVFIDPVGRNIGTTIDAIQDNERNDIDVSLSYYFPDVIKGWLDLSAGLGLKAILIDQSTSDISPPGANFTANGKSRLSATETILAASFPISANIHLPMISKDLFLPVTVTPLAGSDEYIINARGTTTRSETLFGGTLDVSLRYLIKDVALDAGFRYQYLSGVSDYEAWGPFIRLSVPFAIQ